VFEQIISGRANAGVRFVIVGGVAGTAHGSTRLTNDIDICYDTSPDSLEALATLKSSPNPRQETTRS
jgi:hypothetical protein